MDRSWMPTTAGILNIISGAMKLFGGLGLIIFAGFSSMWGGQMMSNYNMPVGLMAGLMGFGGFVILILGVVSIIGGIFALRKKLWGMALAGSITSVLGGNLLLGVAAIVFVVMGKKNFN
jgi:hypothetical protein